MGEKRSNETANTEVIVATRDQYRIPFHDGESFFQIAFNHASCVVLPEIRFPAGRVRENISLS